MHSIIDTFSRISQTQSPDGIAVSVHGFVVGLFLRSPFFQIASLFS